MLRKSYDWIMGFAGHPRAQQVLGWVAFVESSFFPLPPDPLYMAMIMQNREQAWWLASLCTVSSVLGGLVGYAIGFALFETVGHVIIEAYGLQQAFEDLSSGFREHAFLLISLKGLTPIPFKLVTISSGVAAIDLKTFILASLIARGFRFFTLSGLLWYCGPSIKDFIDRNLGLVTLAGAIALIGGFLIFRYL